MCRGETPSGAQPISGASPSRESSAGRGPFASGDELPCPFLLETRRWREGPGAGAVRLLRKYESQGGPGIEAVMRLLEGSASTAADREGFFRTQVRHWLETGRRCALPAGGRRILEEIVERVPGAMETVRTSLPRAFPEAVSEPILKGLASAARIARTRWRGGRRDTSSHRARSAGRLPRHRSPREHHRRPVRRRRARGISEPLSYMGAPRP